VHPDGFLRVPVLMIDDVLVRGYTAALYGEALESRGGVTP
jgi:adenine/guanine phosphoribosyltransferase-like PRPP-binding protein